MTTPKPLLHMPGDLIVCESTSAVVLHVRRLSEAGPMYSGGIDTPFLCAMPRLNGWDTHVPLDAIRAGEAGVCRRCCEALERYTRKRPKVKP